MEQEFITIKDKDGIYRPAAFIRRNDTAGKLAIERVKKEPGDTFVIVKFIEI